MNDSLSQDKKSVLSIIGIVIVVGIVVAFSLDNYRRYVSNTGFSEGIAQTSQESTADLLGTFASQVSKPLSGENCENFTVARTFEEYHNGIDLITVEACDVVAVMDGEVEESGWSSDGEGLRVIINHGDGVRTHYNHADSLYVNKGDIVQKGQKVMHMGCSGLCTGIHLHFGIEFENQFLNPALFLQ